MAAGRTTVSAPWDRDLQGDIEVDLKKFRSAAELARGGTIAKHAINGSWLMLGSSLMCPGEWEKAADCLRQAIPVLPHSAEL